MLDDFTPIIHKLDGRDIKLFAIADTHIGAKEYDRESFEKFISDVSKDPDSYICIVGDLLNNAVRSSVSDVYAEVMSPSQAVDYAVRILQPIADRILGVVGGNHERRSRKEVDLDPLYTVCALLRREDGSNLCDVYRPNMAFIRVNLEQGKTKDHYALMITHGKSFSKRKNFQSIVEGVDAQIYAHSHTPDIFMPNRIRFNSRNTVTIHNVITLTACSWLKAGGYSLSGLYPPQSVSRPQCLILEFTNSNDIKGKIRIHW